MMTRSTYAFGFLCLLAACSSATRPVMNSPAGFNITGDPESSNGATWTFRETVDGVAFDLTGTLMKPSGTGPFPAVVLSHGSDGSAEFFSSLVAPTMVKWGLVCIATNYTHSSGVPLGSPGSADEVGASEPNVLRAHMTHELLRRLSYVDMSRVAIHGHSMGAYLDAVTVAEYPGDFRVASSTGGGVRPDNIFAGPAPSTSQVRNAKTPYQMHHGSDDTVVPLSYDQRFDSILTATNVPHELYIYPGAGHLDVRTSPDMFDRVHAWYASHGMFTATQ